LVSNEVAGHDECNCDQSGITAIGGALKQSAGACTIGGALEQSAGASLNFRVSLWNIVIDPILRSVRACPKLVGNAT